MVNFSCRFTRKAIALKNIVDAGSIGGAYYARTAWNRTRSIPGFGGGFGRSLSLSTLRIRYMLPCA